MMGIFRRNPAVKHVGQMEMSGLIDGFLPIKQRIWSEAHFHECFSCKNEFLGMQETVSLLQKISMDKPQKSFILTRRETQESPWALYNLLGIRRVGVALALVAMLLFAGEFTGLVGSSNDPLPLQVGSKALPSIIRISGESGPENTLSLAPNEESIDTLGHSKAFSEERIGFDTGRPESITSNSETKFKLWYLQIGLFVIGTFLFFWGSLKARKSHF